MEMEKTAEEIKEEELKAQEAIEKTTNIIKIEIQKKKFTTLILLTPWFQKIINSLLVSYLMNV